VFFIDSTLKGSSGADVVASSDAHADDHDHDEL
jgi:hypothetical protein